MYLDWAFQFHNVLYTAAPILVFSVFDMDVDPDTLIQWPQLYKFTRGPTLFSNAIFAKWILLSFVHGAICFFVPWYCWDMAAPSDEGRFRVCARGLWLTAR